MSYTAQEAKEKLLEGNKRYLEAKTGQGDISPEIRLKTAEEGQSPYAIILSCSDSRVIPEEIFSAGIGDLFVIRVAGNVLDSHQIGSVEYAAEHLGSPLVVVLGHTNCGAVHAAIHSDPDGHIKYVTDEIKKAIGHETDGTKAAILNVQRNVEILKEIAARDFPDAELEVCGMLYDLHDGKVSEV